MCSGLRFAQKLLRRASSLARQNLERLTGPHVLDSSLKYEEEKVKWYTPEKFYPVRVWEVFDNRYQVVSEANSRQAAREWEVYRHLNSITTSHAGSKCVPMLLDSFNNTTDTGSHICMVHKPLGLRISDFQGLIPGGKLPQDILKFTLKHFLLALEFLHSECHLAHCDLQAKNILMGIDDEDVLTEFEEAEVRDPILCDFGEARIGDGKFTEDIQLFLYRAPEVILQKSWDKKVDIWNLGVLIWDLSQSKHLFDARDANNETTNIMHLAEMIALLGSPPKSFVEGSPIVGDYFDKSRRWIGDNLTGKEKILFLQFMRKMLRWVPEKRMSAFDLLDDPWLNS
ncbi:kinase-like domain-containing protein [Rhexocercosporidium sp. MPI-PUGE-AT-0058]|nr:kinase-like domain-containing protein [Rhexocercosporidium sp. MPI-PUGE-AT-0058]